MSSFRAPTASHWNESPQYGNGTPPTEALRMLSLDWSSAGAGSTGPFVASAAVARTDGLADPPVNTTRAIATAATTPATGAKTRQPRRERVLRGARPRSA